VTADTEPGGAGLAGRQVLVGVGGSLAAYKAADLVVLLRRQGATVRVAMTPSATRFIAPLTLRSLSGNPAVTDLFDPPEGGHGMEHLSLSEWAEVVVIVAVSANLLARLALGLSDDAVTATVLASRAPLLVAPAMETAMWEHPATQDHVATLRARGAVLVGPVIGRLGSGREGLGRMAEPEAIASAVAGLLRERSRRTSP
jgi:phosphopantothenoylcysteine decarboxylase/phosphopantothenate--cysteine ligase